MKHIYTIGHSNRPLNVFVDLLRSNNIELLVDVRGGDAPGSKTFPQFNKGNLAVSLPAHDIQYLHFKDLGGRRKQQPIDQTINEAWRNAQFKNYADWAHHSEEAEQALDKLCYYAEQCTVAYMCSEAVPWMCHRQIITDNMILRKGFDVTHIVGKNQTMKATVNKHAHLKDNKVIYPLIDPDLFE